MYNLSVGQVPVLVLNNYALYCQDYHKLISLLFYYNTGAPGSATYSASKHAIQVYY